MELLLEKGPECAGPCVLAGFLLLGEDEVRGGNRPETPRGHCSKAGDLSGGGWWRVTQTGHCFRVNQNIKPKA